MVVIKGEYYRHYPDADKYDPKDVKNPEAIDEWLKAYRKIYELCEKYGCKEWGNTDYGGTKNPILTPEEMTKQIYEEFDNGEDFYHVFAPSVDDFNYFDPKVSKLACNGPFIKIWVGTRNKNQVRLKKPIIVCDFNMPGYEINSYSAHIDPEDPDAKNSLMVPVAVSETRYYYWEKKQWDFDEFCSEIDKFDEFILKNKKEYEPVLLELHKKIEDGGDIEALAKEVNDKYNFGWQFGNMF